MRVDLDERALLCDLMLEYGPDAPTLCEGWAVRDLAGHLVLRERRPDAAPGVLIPALRGRADRVQNEYAARWPEVVNLVRTGPPRWMPTSLPSVGKVANTAEFFVHHEDVRRAQQGWRPRPADAERDRALWGAVGRMAWLPLRKAPCGVRMHAEGHGEIVARKGTPSVRIDGAPGELLLFALGRDQYQLDFEGDPDLVRALTSSERKL
ncbi:TIGR03085 family metal-binding protein [Sciscionella marina]|uniref:TIGR03085 family metal-binding protein n=1 Tax=Sciscionella marina TaxID=508770 RepID=UPI00036CCBCF|nr:TIGR03085 family metal-binding protein [Sciscionella marina]